MLEARDLTLAHGNNTVLLGVSLSFAAGDVTALCGPNGAGKSTLLAAMAGDLKPVTGEVRIDGCKLSEMTPSEMAHQRAVLEQSPSLSAVFDVRTLTELSIPREVSPAQTTQIATETLRKLDLFGLAETAVQRLSGGQKHRAHLARVLAQLAASRTLGGGKVLMLDEPTASLDITHQIAVMRAARDAARDGTAVIVVLHDLNLAAAFSDRIVMLNNGGVAAEASPVDVLTPELLSDVYETPIAVTTDGSAPVVTPVYASGNA